MTRSSKRPNVDCAGPATADGVSPNAIGQRAVLVACIVVCLGTSFAYAGASGFASLVYRLIFDGSVLIAWLVAVTGLGSVVLTILPVSEDTEDSVLTIVTASAMGMGLLSLLLLGLGLIGFLNQITAIGLLVVGASIGCAVVAKRFDGIRPNLVGFLSAPAGASWLWLIAMPFLGLAIIAALLPPGTMWPGEPHWYDVVEYHLQIPREWYELGRIVPLHHNAFSFFPFNVEMHYLLAMHLRGGPWAGMYLANFMHLSMVVLTIGAVYGFAKKLANSSTNAIAATLFVATIPWLTQLGSIAYNEGGFLLFSTLAIGWAFRAAIHPIRRLGRFPVAGLMAGFACGCKLTAVPEVLFAVGGISVLGILLTRRADVSLRVRLTGVAFFFIAGLIAFSPWLIRNQIWAHNPVFPEGAAVFGKAHFSDTQVERWKQAHSPRPDQQSVTARFKAWTNDVWLGWQFGYVLLPLGVIASIASIGRRHEQSRSTVFLLIALFVALSIIWLFFTHLQSRFFILAAPIAGMFIATLPRGRVFTVSALALLLMASTIGFVRLHSTLTERIYENRLVEALGFESLSEFMVPKPFADRLNADPTAPAALIGDGRTFVYPSPMSRLHYRTVFDVDVKPGESVIDAWRAGSPSDATLFVDPLELRRFHDTYYGVPALAPEYSGRNEPFILSAQKQASDR